MTFPTAIWALLIAAIFAIGIGQHKSRTLTNREAVVCQSAVGKTNKRQQSGSAAFCIGYIIAVKIVLSVSRQILLHNSRSYLSSRMHSSCAG